MRINYAPNAAGAPADGTISAAKLSAAAVTAPKVAAGVYKYRIVTGRNGTGNLTVSGAAGTDTLEEVLNITDGGSILADFNATVGTGLIAQTSSTDYSAKKLMIVLKAGA